MKVRYQPAMNHHLWVKEIEGLSMVRQCELAGVTRSSAYSRSRYAMIDKTELQICRLIARNTRVGHFMAVVEGGVSEAYGAHSQTQTDPETNAPVGISMDGRASVG